MRDAGSFSTRRQFVKAIPVGLALASVPEAVWAASEETPWQMGLIADLHFGLAPDALERLEAFMTEVERIAPSCLLQLGDFNYGTEDAERCLKLWNEFRGPRYHVLGNHDMDKTDKAHQVELWEMPGRYYSFDRRGWHIVALDRNNFFDGKAYTPYAKGNYFRQGHERDHADPEQLEWLAEDLARTELPTVVFAHQGLGMTEKIEAATASGKIERVLASANEATPSKVVAVFCGHHHVDRYQFRDGIHFVWINSASYSWIGEKFGGMAPYRDPLYTFLTFHSDKSIEIRGKDSAWRPPTPEDRGYPDFEQINAHIRGRRLLCGKPGRKEEAEQVEATGTR